MTGRHGPHANHHVQHAPKPPPLVHAPKGTGSHAAPQDVHSNHHGQPVHPEQRYPHGTTGHATHGHGAQHPYPYQRIENMSIGHPHPPGSHTAVPHPEGTGHATHANVNPHVLSHGGDVNDHARTHGDEGDRKPERRGLLSRLWNALERNNPYAGGEVPYPSSKRKKKEEEHLGEGSHLHESGPSGPPLGGGRGSGNSRNGSDGTTHVGSGSGPGPGPQYYGDGGGGVNGGGGGDAGGGGCGCDCSC